MNKPPGMGMNQAFSYTSVLVVSRVVGTILAKSYTVTQKQRNLVFRGKVAPRDLPYLLSPT